MRIWVLVQQLTFILERGNRLFPSLYQDCLIPTRRLPGMENWPSMEYSFSHQKHCSMNSWSIVNDPKKTDYVGAELKNIVASHSNIALDEINTVIEYEEMTNSFAFGSMEILSWLVFLFGVINLINTTLSNQIARKQENSILRSIGLTQKQLCEMNICEGLCYALFATLATLIVGLPASIFACRKMSIGAFAGNVVPYKFPVLEMGLFILVLFGMELILSVWTIRRQKKQSLIEQMRAME